MSIDSLAGGWAKALSMDRKQFNMFFDSMMDGFAYHKIVLDKTGKPVDYVFLEVNHTFEELSGLKREKIIGKKVTEVLAGIEDDPADLIGTYGRVALTGEPCDFENYSGPLDKWFRVSAYCPEKGYFVALFEDITLRKKAEATLMESEQRWATTLASIGDAVIATDTSCKITFMNGVAEELTGWKLREASGKPVQQVFNIINEFTRKAVENPVSHVLKKGSIVGLANHTILIRNDGSEVPIDDSGAPIKDKDGKVTGVVLIFRDITERKKAEEALQESEQRWATTLASIGDAVIATDLSGKITFVNAEAEGLTGWESRDALGKPIKTIFNIVNEQTRLEVENPIDKVLERGLVVGLANHTVLIRKDGSEVPIDDSGAPITGKDGKVTGVVLIFRDITERKKAEDTLKKINDELEERVQQRTAQVSMERQRLYNVLETLPTYVILLDSDHRVTFANKVFRETFGEDHGRRCHEYLFNKDHECEGCITYNVYRENKPQHWYWTGPNKHDYDIYDFPFKEADGSTLILEMGIDITERKKAEENVQQERKRLFNVLETLPAMICLLTPDYHIAFANRSFREKFGESHGRNCYDYCFGYKEPCKFCESYTVLKTGQPHHWEVNGPDGSVIDAYDFPFTDVDGSKLILEMDIDITPRKKAEAQALESAKKLKDAERLAAIGATAGMVGHDIRNPLQAITGDLYLAKTELSVLPENDIKANALENLAEIEKNIDYINKIVADLQDYARPLNPKLQEANVKTIFNEVLAKNGIPKNIKVHVEVEGDAEKVMADPDYLKRIAANLTLNAVQAMPDGGKLTIRGYVDKQTKDVLITVKDTGVGIPEDVKPKLFTPMMTTKSKGQGFGLAVVKRMTEGLGGTVTFESTEGKGTTFILRFPPPKELNGKLVFK